MKKFSTLLFALILALLYSTNTQAGFPRTVICEDFTSTTCPPCAPANQYFDNWFANYGGQDQVTVVKYHVWWPSPGNDPYYLANTSEVQTRNTYYANNYAPHMFIDGNVDGGSSYTSWPGLIEPRFFSFSPLEIKLSGTFTATSGTVNIKIRNDGTTIPSGTLVLHTVVVENGLLYTGPNGDPRHEQVMRKMYPNASGETFTIALNDSASFTKNITWNSSWVMNNCEVVVFVQVKETKAILQAAKQRIDELVVGVNEQQFLPQSVLLHQNYPNPFNPSTIIKYDLPTSSFVTIRIVNILGQEVATMVNEQREAGTHSIVFDASSNKFTSGVYCYRLTTGNTTQIRKFVLMK